jgi:hypothetical protein
MTTLTDIWSPWFLEAFSVNIRLFWTLTLGFHIERRLINKGLLTYLG